MTGILRLFDPTGFPPRWACGEWSDFLGWLHIGSDVATWGAYTAIPLVLAHFVRTRRVPYPRVIWLFVGFILACGITHLTEAIIFWYPVYRFAGVSKLVTAAVSWATVVVLVRATPRVMRLPGFDELSESLTVAREERERAEARSRHLASLVERSSDMIVGLGPSGEVGAWNRAASRVLGYTEAEVLGRPLADLADASVAPEIARFVSAAVEGTETVETTVLLRQATGAHRELELSAAPLEPLPGDPLVASVVARDVTERNRARRELVAANQLLEEANRTLEDRVAARTEELQRSNESLQREVAERRAAEAELRRSEALLAEAHRMAGLGAWSWFPDEDRIVWTDSLYDLFGYERGTDLGPAEHHFERVYPPHEVERIESAVIAALEQGEPYDLELETRLENGPRYIRARGEPRVGPDGRIDRIEGTILDVTIEKEQARALEEANARLEAAVAEATEELRATVARLQVTNQELESFVHMASHDMQEPLRTLRSYSRLLTEDVGPNLSEDARDDLRFIQEAAGRMQRMIDALLELSQTGRAEPRAEPVELRPLIEGILEDFSESIVERGAQVTIEPLPTPVGDPRLLERVFSNLVSNAIKFGGVPPTVRIFGEETEAGWVLSVEDNGAGIDEHFVERAFEPFKRLPHPAPVPGTGMGLTICKRAMELQEGRIWVERGASGGACFKLHLPRERSPS